MLKPVSSIIALTAFTIAATGCTSSGNTESESSEVTGPEEWNREVTAPSDTEAEVSRESCVYQAGALPKETQGSSYPNGDEIPVNHIIILMMENRSFDHYFQKLPEYGITDVEVAPDNFTNPDFKGNDIAPYHDTKYCLIDTNHEWSGSHEQYNDGKMDGFVFTNDGYSEEINGMPEEMYSGSRAMSYYDETDIPFYYWLATQFAIGDHYYSSLLGPTFPNRSYLYSATSFGLTKNTLVDPDKTIFDYLELRGVDWKVYQSTSPGMGLYIDQVLKYEDEHIRDISEYFTDAANGTLPSVAFVDPAMARGGVDANDEHPPADLQIGQEFVAQVTQALTESPNWSDSAMFWVYDEHGGFFDHVEPPPACIPDDYAPQLEEGDPEAEFDRYGFRVPFAVISPYAKKGFVAHETYDHSSILRFIEARFVIPALTNRDANALGLWEFFDFDNAPNATPPTITVPTIDQEKLSTCKDMFGE